MKVLIKFNHGLGDCVQFTSVLQHLRKHHPNWKITFLTKAGKHSAAIGLCERATSNQAVESEHFDSRFDIRWNECFSSYSGHPSTKVERCLKEEFSIEPELELCKYIQVIREEALNAARAYLIAIGAKRLGSKHDPEARYNVVTIHYQGNTSTEKKNINHDQAKLLCDQLIKVGLIPIILDWDERSPLIDNKTIFCPNALHPLWDNIGTGDAERIAALIKISKYFVGIDSGPGHAAAATNTPSLLVWFKHHPINYYHPSSNILHLIPHNIESFVHAGGNGSVDFFKKHYRFEEYTNFAQCLIHKVHEMGNEVHNMSSSSPLTEEGNLIQSGDFWIRYDNAEQDMVIVRDVYQQDSYRLNIIPGIIQNARFIVDVGAHIGCFATLVHKLNPNCKICCVEVCPENILALKKNVGDFATIIQAACTYDKVELMLLNAVRPNCESTGGSTVIPFNLETQYPRQAGYKYWSDKRVIEKVTLEQIMNQCGETKIDLLKLDCEGSEFSILENTPSRDSIRFIVGEYHEKERWEKLIQNKFTTPNWAYGKMYTHPNGLGIFHLSNMNWED